MSEIEPKNNAPLEDDGFDREEVDAKLIGVLVLATIAVIVISILGVQYYYDTYYERQVFVKVLEPVSSQLQDLRAREDQQLHSYEYIDRDKGTVRLTIERSMELLADDYRSGALKYPTTPYPVQPEEEPRAQ